MSETPDSFQREEFRTALLRLIRVGTVMMQNDPELRSAVADLAAVLIPTQAPSTKPAGEITPPASVTNTQALPTTSPATAAPVRASFLPAPQAPPRPATVTGPRLVHEMKLGDSRMMIETQGGFVRSVTPLASSDLPSTSPTHHAVSHEPDSSWISILTPLGPIAARARLKAAALREPSAIAREGLRARWIELAGDETPSAADELPFATSTSVSTPEADALEALALACDLGTLLRERGQLHAGNDLGETFQAMAHAQSCVRSFARTTVTDQDRQRNDSDQVIFFTWMRTVVAPEHCATFIRDYFRLDHLAPASDGPEVLTRLREIEASWKTRLDAERDARKARDKLRDKCRNLSKKDEAEREVEARLIEENLTRLASARENLLASPIIDFIRNAIPHLPASARELPNLALLIESIEGRSEDRTDASSPEETDADVARLREELRSRSIRRVVIAGGEFKPLKRDALRTLMALEDVIWVEVEKTKSNAGLDGRVKAAQPDLVLSTRWMSHPDEAKVTEAARDLGVPLIRLMSEGALGNGPLTKTILDHFATSDARAK